MKTTLVFELLVLFLYTVCAELVETSAVRSSSQSRRLQEVSEVFGEGFGEVGEANSGTYIPAPFIDMGFWRTGDILHPIYYDVTGPPACLNHCQFAAPNCVAFNYDQHSHDCYVLSSLGEMHKNETSITALYGFVNEDVCNTENFIPGYHRAGHDYEIKTEVATDTDCCKMCKDRAPICTAWDYNSILHTCFLKKVIPLLKTRVSWAPALTTGLGAECVSLSCG